MSHTTISKLENWSLLDPKPVLYFDEYVYEWMVIWNGVYMPIEYALMLSSAYFWSIPVSNDMKHEAFLKLKKHKGISPWIENSKLKNAEYAYYCYSRKMKPHLDTLKHMDKCLILQWFDKFFTSDK